MLEQIRVLNSLAHVKHFVKSVKPKSNDMVIPSSHYIIGECNAQAVSVMIAIIRPRVRNLREIDILLRKYMLDWSELTDVSLCRRA